MSKSTQVGGLAMIALGLLLLLGKFGLFGNFFVFYWPIFVLLPALFFHYLFFIGKAPSFVLVPGGMLTLYSLMFFYCNILGWNSMTYLWPGFILGVGIGTYEMYFFSPIKSRAAWGTSIFFLLAAAVFFGLAFTIKFNLFFVAASLVVIGLLMVFRK